MEVWLGERREITCLWGSLEWQRASQITWDSWQDNLDVCISEQEPEEDLGRIYACICYSMDRSAI